VRRERCPQCGRFVSLRNVGNWSIVQFYDHGWYCNSVCLADWREANELAGAVSGGE